jgi:hypothetical protein
MSSARPRLTLPSWPAQEMPNHSFWWCAEVFSSFWQIKLRKSWKTPICIVEDRKFSSDLKVDVP